MTQKRSTGKPSSGRRRTTGSERLKIDTSPLTSDQPVGIFSSLEAASDSSKSTVPLAKISLSSSQPRRYFSQELHKQLVESVKRDGILQPMLVRPIEGDRFELVAGERRYRAATEAGLSNVPVTIREMTSFQARQYALVENLQREDLNPVEETEGILTLLEMRLGTSREEIISLLNRMARVQRGLTDNVVREEVIVAVNEIFASVGRLTPESFRTHRLPLLNLPEDIVEALRAGRIEYTKAKALAQLKDINQRQQLLEEAIEQELSLSQIRERLKGFKESFVPEAPGSEVLLKRGSKVSRLIKKSAALSDPQARKKLDKLLSEIEKLLG